MINLNLGLKGLLKPKQELKKFDLDTIKEYKSYPQQKQWINDCWNAREKVTLFLGARKYGKSVWVTQVGIALFLYNNPQGTVLLVSRTATNARRIMRGVNSILISLGVSGRFGQDITMLDGLSQTNEIQFSLRGIGTGTYTKGTHVDYLVMDDPVEPEDEKSQKAKENANLKYEEYLNLADKIIVVGQYVSEDDLYVKLEERREESLKKGEIPDIQVIKAPYGTIPELDMETMENWLKKSTLRKWGLNYELKFYPDPSMPFSELNFSNGPWLETVGKIYAALDIAHGGGDCVALTIAKSTESIIECIGFCWTEGIWDVRHQVLEVLRRTGSMYLVLEKQSDPNLQIFNFLKKTCSV